MKQNLLNLSFHELITLFKDMGEAGYRAEQVFRWIYKKHIFDVSKMTDLPLNLRNLIQEKYDIKIPSVIDLEKSRKGDAQKLLLKLHDSHLIETVIMKDPKGRITFCISSQVGCPLGCKFCATGKMGFFRNLEVGEIIGQVLVATKIVGKRANNIVFMGMGEPFLNYDNVIKSARILMHRRGYNIGARRITISTAGIADRIRDFADENTQIRLAVSLNSPFDSVRSELMPINRRYNIEKLIKALKYYQQKTGRRFTIEYALMRGVNDRIEDIYKIVELFRKFKYHLNLIPINRTKNGEFMPPSKQRIELLKKELQNLGINFTFRISRGQDISAACGQLATKNAKRKFHNAK